MKRIFLFLFISFLSLEFFSQCELPDNSKVEKLYKKSLDRKKTKDPKKRFKFLLEAIEEDEECVPCLWELANRSFKNAKYKGASYDRAEEYFLQIENLCSDYHSEVYYFLGLIYFNQDKTKKAEEYFKKFIDFRSQEENKFSKNYESKLKAAKSVLPELNFKNTFFNNPVPFKPKLVENVSTNGEEYLPMISADDENLFFTRVYNKKGLGDIVTTRVEELIVSKRNTSEENFDKGTALPKPFNVGQNYGGVSISINNKELYLCACEKYNDYNNCDIFVSNYKYLKNEKTGKYFYKWSTLKNLGENINGNNTWEAQPSISADGKTLFFATSRPTSKGIDIYYSTRNKDGEWTKAKSLGNVINTGGNDKAPFLHTDSKTLYFASQVTRSRRGAGDYDIFYSRQADDGKWSEPINIGFPINSSQAEDGLIVNISGETAYFSSGRIKGGEGGKDIYSFQMPEKAKPQKVVLMKGKMKDENGKPITKTKLTLSYKDSTKNKDVEINSDDGNFAVAINMEEEKKVIVTVKNKKTAYQSRLIKEEEVKSGVVRNKDIIIEKLKKGKGFVINDIKFVTNSYDLNENARFILDNFSKYLLHNKDISFKIVGHTDNIGREKENMLLSSHRANSVKEYLINKGIKESRIKSEGKGESSPKVPNTSEHNRQINRRTEFVVLDF